MNRYLKQEIKKAFEVPLPDQQEKAQFLRAIPQPHISMLQFILAQVAYLRKWVLVFSVLLLLPALISACHTDPDTLWLISSLLPFLGLLAVTENTRSAVYEMQEFEMSARFSLKSVVLARMSVLGLLDAIVICCLIPLCGIGNDLSLLQTGIYLLVPYLLTVNISLYLARCFHGREALYGCMFTAVLVSVGSCGLHLFADFIYQFSYLHWWILFTVFLIGKTAREIYHTIKQTEELAWNS